MKITLSKKSLQVASLFAAKATNPRANLCGAMVILTNKDAKLVSTNGHAMSVQLLPNQCAPDLEDDKTIEVIVPTEALKHFKPQAGYDPALEVLTLEFMPQDTNGHSQDCSLTDYFGSGTHFKSIAGRFPDYRRVCAEDSKLKDHASHYETALLCLFAKAAKILTGKEYFDLTQYGEKPAIINIGAFFLGVIMPMKSKPAKLPTWL